MSLTGGILPGERLVLAVQAVGFESRVRSEETGIVLQNCLQNVVQCRPDTGVGLISVRLEIIMFFQCPEDNPQGPRGIQIFLQNALYIGGLIFGQGLKIHLGCFSKQLSHFFRDIILSFMC